MLLAAPANDEAPHLAALRRGVEAGFRFRHFRDPGGEVAVIYAERWCSYGVVENCTLRAMTEAVAARFRIEDHPGGDPLWQATGSVAEVLTALLDLPPHGHPGAPTSPRRPSSALWLPGSPCRRFPSR
ncbi:hypothetical protein [Saccharopolyspora taberi]|uniref:Uncharacterized protein n=1 Tax=Saccharopolyspora taberi TaxID=60895 RepID=A0ABN3VHN4_9PSEU